MVGRRKAASAMGWWCCLNRAVVRLSGSDSAKLLQGLVTNDVDVLAKWEKDEEEKKKAKRRRVAEEERIRGAIDAERTHRDGRVLTRDEQKRDSD